MQQKDNINLLNAVVRTSEMGKNTLDQMIPMAGQPRFKGELMRQRQGFQDFNRQAHAALDACGAKAEGVGPMEKLMTKAGIAGKTMGDRSTRTMAEMLLEGSQMGVTECVTGLKDFPNASAGARQLATGLQEFQEQNMETLKEYL